jgi:uncharacterized protein
MRGSNKDTTSRETRLEAASAIGSAKKASLAFPLHRGKRNFSFRASGNKGRTSKDNERLYDLIDSKIVNVCYRVFEPSISLTQYVELNRFKLYLADTGLFTTMLFNAASDDHEDIYKKLLSRNLCTNQGYLYENAVSQMLVASGRAPYYFTWPKKEGSPKHYEIDFLYGELGKIIPLEVKSNRISSHESIDKFKDRYSKIAGPRYLVSCKDYKKMGDLINIPFYELPFLLEGKRKIS